MLIINYTFDQMTKYSLMKVVHDAIREIRYISIDNYQTHISDLSKRKNKK